MTRGDLSQDLQPQMPLESGEVLVTMQKQMVVYDTKRRDQNIDSLSNSDARATQLPKVLGGAQCHGSADQIRARQIIHQLAGTPKIRVASESLQEFGQDEISGQDLRLGTQSDSATALSSAEEGLGGRSSGARQIKSFAPAFTLPRRNIALNLRHRPALDLLNGRPHQMHKPEVSRSLPFAAGQRLG